MSLSFTATVFPPGIDGGAFSEHAATGNTRLRAAAARKPVILAAAILTVSFCNALN
jgi:hypothetical protein